MSYESFKKIKMELLYVWFSRTDYREKIEEFISSITLSEDIESIVSRIPEALTLDAKEYPTIAVVIKKLGNDRLKDIVTDEATFKDGEFTKLTITRKGKKVTFVHLNGESSKKI